MRIGSVYDQTSTTEFVAMLDSQCDNEKLLFSYVELATDGGAPKPNGERIIARITNVLKENPLLSRDQAGVSASIDIKDLGFEFSRRFTYGWAQCTVIGMLTGRGLDMNRRGIMPNAQVHTPSAATLRQLFFRPLPSYVPLGSIETFGEGDVAEVPVTLDADQLVTKHFCVFGMTGSGKTNTAAKLLEEFLARGHKTIIFDPHDDYQALEDFSNLFRLKDANGLEVALDPVSSHSPAVQRAIQLLRPEAVEGRDLDRCMYERLLRTASVIYANTPARQFLLPGREKDSAKQVSTALVDAVAEREPWRRLVSYTQMCSFRCFPELKNYGNGFQDFTIGLLEAFRGESFSLPQRRWLRKQIGCPGQGVQYLAALKAQAETARSRALAPQGNSSLVQVLNVLIQSFDSLQDIYTEAQTAGAQALDIASFFRQVAARSGGETANPRQYTVYRLSLTDLSSNLRKAMVYAVVTYFFRSYKFQGYRVNPKGDEKAAYPVLFVLEEARALIPKASGIQDDDVAAARARRAMREIAYEGRKFSLGFGLVSQKPSTVDQEVVSQANTFVLHQLKSPDDQQYVRTVTESMSQDELDMIKSLGTGRAIVAGVAVQSPVLLRVYERYSREGIKEPTPILDDLSSVSEIRRRLGAADQ